jgi:hypothetical protein
MGSLERFAQVAEDALGLLEGVEAVRHDVTLLSSFAVRMPSKRSRMSEQIPISFSTSKLEMGSSSTMYWGLRPRCPRTSRGRSREEVAEGEHVPLAR